MTLSKRFYKDCMSILQFEHISFAYGDGHKVFENLSLELPKNQRVGVIGDNGCGKSTLLHLGAAIIKPSSGYIRLHGQLCETKGDIVRLRRSLGYLLQNSEDQLFCPTVLEDIAFGPANYGDSLSVAEEKARAIASRFGIEHLLERSGISLSGGEKKLAALAAVMVTEPEFLFLDEPTNDLDAKSRASIATILLESDLPFIMVSHDELFLEQVCNICYLVENYRLRTLWES